MWAWRSLIYFCTPSLSYLTSFLDPSCKLLFFIHFFHCKIFNLNISVGILLNFDLFLAFPHQITNILFVDFVYGKRKYNVLCLTFFSFFNSIKDIINHSWNYPSIWVFPQHCVSFPTPSLPIGEDGGIVAICEALNEIFSTLLINLGLNRSLITCWTPGSKTRLKEKQEFVSTLTILSLTMSIPVFVRAISSSIISFLLKGRNLTKVFILFFVDWGTLPSVIQVVNSLTLPLLRSVIHYSSGVSLFVLRDDFEKDLCHQKRGFCV